MSLRTQEPETRKELDKAILDLSEKKKKLIRAINEAGEQLQVTEKELSFVQSQKERLEKCHFQGCHPDIIDAIQELDLKEIFLSSNIASYSQKAKDGRLKLVIVEQLLSEYEDKLSLLLRPWEVSRPRSESSLSSWGAV